LFYFGTPHFLVVVFIDSAFQLHLSMFLARTIDHETSPYYARQEKDVVYVNIYMEFGYKSTGGTPTHGK
jgi:hypothetical protein